jgi:hypothetical protein
MKPSIATILLVAVNGALALALGNLPSPEPEPSLPKLNAVQNILREQTHPIVAPPKRAEPPPTEFAAIYSSNPPQFVANLRAIGCPEETIKDILVAEISRGFYSQEQALRPTPADHVPNGWSPRTVEGRLIARRQEAAAIARQKASALRDALGYEAPVQMPTYAMTVSDQNFQHSLDELPQDKRLRAQQIHNEYWTQVQRLRERTRGFWLPEDVADLELLKQNRANALNQLRAP